MTGFRIIGEKLMTDGDTLTKNHRMILVRKVGEFRMFLSRIFIPDPKEIRRGTMVTKMMHMVKRALFRISGTMSQIFTVEL